MHWINYYLMFLTNKDLKNVSFYWRFASHLQVIVTSRSLCKLPHTDNRKSLHLAKKLFGTIKRLTLKTSSSFYTWFM